MCVGCKNQIIGKNAFNSSVADTGTVGAFGPIMVELNLIILPHTHLLASPAWCAIIVGFLFLSRIMEIQLPVKICRGICYEPSPTQLTST